MSQPTFTPEPEGQKREAIERDLGEFVTHLETAQTLWRRYPSLVEADELPERFLRAYKTRNGSEYSLGKATMTKRSSNRESSRERSERKSVSRQ